MVSASVGVNGRVTCAGSDTGEQSDGTNDTASDSSVDGAGDLEPTSSARLANLETSVGTLDPLFSSDINSYSVVLDVATESLELTATLDDPDALLRLNGMTEVSGVAIPIEVQTGEVRNLVFEVTSADATTKNRYTVQVFRGAPPLYSREIAKLFPKKGETDDHARNH